jgi:nitrilase
MRLSSNNHVPKETQCYEKKRKVGGRQAAPVWLDRDATIGKACELIQRAGEAGADIVGFPENFIHGHPVWFYFYPATSEKSMALGTRLFQNSVEIPSASTDLLCREAAKAGVFGDRLANYHCRLSRSARSHRRW